MDDLINKVHQIDALALLAKLADASVDMFLTSPPYNLRNSTGNGLKGENNKSLWPNQPMRHGYAGGFTDDMPHSEYITWQRGCITEMLRATKNTGCIFYNHKWRVQDGLLQRLGDEITSGFPVRQIIIWNRLGGFNFNQGYFLPSYEVIYLITKQDFVLQPGSNALMDVWNIPPLQGKEHPNAFPESLAKRCIQSATDFSGLIVDPFAGSGTTALAAATLNRRYIAGDISADYCTIARKRLAAYTPDMFELLGVQS